MNFKIIVLTLSFFCSFSANKPSNHIKINIPTAEDEAKYIWNTIKDINFFEKFNYQISLPKGTFIDTLKSKARKKKLSKSDYESLISFMQDSIYSKKNYNNGYKKVHEQLSLINKMIKEINELELNWKFKKFETYQVNLTLYGPGGSYNPDEGSILIYTTSNGNFKGYSNPAYTIIHEIVHIGIQESIIDKYNLPHSLKERIVDNMVSLCFGKYLSEYKVQDMGDNRIDSYLKTKGDIKNLQKYVAEILKNDN